MDPLTVAAEPGVNTALNMALLPAAIVVDVVRPVRLNPVPVVEICENVSVAVPWLLSVMGCELLFPTMTFPKLTVVGFAAICA